MPRKPPEKLPPGVRRRPGRPYEIFYADPAGKRVQETAGSDLREAVRLRAERIEEVRAGTWTRADQRRHESLTVASWSATWLERRAARPNPPRTLHDDAARLRDWILPVIGSVKLEELTVDHVRRVLHELRTTPSERTGKPLAANTITNAFGTLAKCLRDAAKELGRAGVAWVPPVDKLDDDEVPVLVDRPREGFSRSEVESLISDARIPEDRRTFWALLALTGLRHNEGAGLRWCDVDFRAEPLARIALTQQAGGLRLKEDKRGRGLSREIPVHPVLRGLLEAWRTEGFARLHGRHPRDTDYIAPRDTDVSAYRLNRTSLGQLRRDCEALGLSRHCVHEFRNSFATLASIDAPELEAVIAGITHQTTPVRGAFRTYVATQSRWLARCAAVERLDIRLVRHAEVVAIPLAASSGVTRSVTCETEPPKSQQLRTVTSVSAVAHAVVRPAVLGALAKARRGEAERVHEGGGRVGHGRPPARRARVDRVEAESCEAKRTPSAKLHDSEKPSGRA
jgi:integrase